MSFKWYGRLGVVLLVLLGCPGCEESTHTNVAPPERIVLVVVDTLRRDHVAPYSNRVATPHIAALARRGQTFGNAFSSYHQTTMSMSSLFTGRTPSIERGHGRERLDWTGLSWCGLERFMVPGEPVRCIPPNVSTLAEQLREAGYWTLGVTSNALLYRPGGYERGFDRWVELPRVPVEAGRVNHAVQRELSQRPQDRFFLYVHYMDVHDYRERRQSYASGVQIIDRAFGRLSAMLEALGLLDGTVVFFTSDHGEHLENEKHFARANRGHTGSPSFDTLLQVPLIVAPPMFTDTSALQRGDDVHRMILSVAGANDGAPPELEPGEIYLSERHFQTYRHRDWKSFRHRKTGKHFLVDLKNDPGERRSVSDDHVAVRDAHAARMDELARTLGAPEAADRSLSPQDRERLRTLGYEAEE